MVLREEPDDPAASADRAAEPPTQVIFMGFSRTLLVGADTQLPPGSVTIVEEPEVIGRRNLADVAAGFPAVARVLPWEYQRPEAVTALLEAEPGLETALAVVPGVEYGVLPAAKLADALGIPGAGTAAAATFRDKAKQRAAAANAGLPNPPYAVVANADEVLAFVDRIGMPCVVKPTARQASVGVRVVHHTHEARAAFAAAAAPLEQALAPSRGIPSQVMVEQAMIGDEYSVELLVVDGTAVFANVTAKRLVGGPYPVELAHVVPAPPSAPHDVLVDATIRLVGSAGLRYGVVHAEWIVSGATPMLVECAARVPGDEITTLLSLAYDGSFVAAYVRLMSGLPPELPPRPRGAASIRFLTADCDGTVKSVDGVDDARAMPGVVTLSVPTRPGARVRRPTSSWDRLGYVIARADSPGEAEQRACAAAAAIRIDVTPDHKR